jgi:uncharacterized membrane protein
MGVLVLGLVLFLGMHSVAIVAPSLRERVCSRLGEGAWKGLYTLVSLAGLALIIYGFGLARPAGMVLYSPPSWLRRAALVLMLPVFPLLIAAYLPGRIQRAAKHPMLASVKLWAFAHLLANGLLADVVLFGVFLVWAVADRISLKHRAPRMKPSAPPGRWNDAIAVVLGLAIYVLTIGWLHEWIFGVSPLT